MRLSVLIVTRNRHRELEGCLKSLLTQKKLPDEIIIVDNGPSAETRAVVEKFTVCLPVKYAVELKKGTPFARNKALKLAKGEIVAFTDDDCLLDKDWLFQIESFFKKNPQAKVVIGKTKNFYLNNLYAQVSYFFYQKWQNESDNLFDTKNIAFKRDLAERFNLRFDPGFTPFGCGEDLTFGKELKNKGIRFNYFSKMLLYHKEPDTFLRLFESRFERGRMIFFMRKFKSQDVALNKKISGSSFKDFFSLISRFERNYSLDKKVAFRFLILIGYLAKNLGYFFSFFENEDTIG